MHPEEPHVTHKASESSDQDWRLWLHLQPETYPVGFVVVFIYFPLQTGLEICLVENQLETSSLSACVRQNKNDPGATATQQGYDGRGDHLGQRL